MKDNKLTDKAIIKALECCKMPVGSGSCNDCPFDHQRKKRLTSTDKSCTTLMFDYALDLINRQQAEIERLQNESIGNCELAISMRNDNNLKGDCSYCIDKAKAEAIKEYIEKLKDLSYESDLYDRNERWVRAVTIEEIDETYKEMGLE